jgi:hypothetical protein
LCGFGDIDNTKSVTAAWKIVCTPIDEGGLSLRPLKLIKKFVMLRLCWIFISSDFDWDQLVIARCFRNGHLIHIIHHPLFGEL